MVNPPPLHTSLFVVVTVILLLEIVNSLKLKHLEI
jgi:hypothetical protein